MYGQAMYRVSILDRLGKNVTILLPPPVPRPTSAGSL